MLNVDGEKVQVPATHAWNVVLMEECFDLHISWAKAVSISFTTRTANGVKIVPIVGTTKSGARDVMRLEPQICFLFLFFCFTNVYLQVVHYG
jgi:hypothetical protein